MNNKFPRKEIYVYTSKTPLKEGEVLALNDRKIELTPSFKEYSERKWETENKGWTSSIIPSAVDVEVSMEGMKVHCGLTEYKYLLGMVKLITETKTTDSAPSIHGLSTEIMPLTLDGIFLLNRREKSTTQHGIGFYDIPNAGQNAQMWLDKIPKEQSGLVNGLFDLVGFPKWNMIRNIVLTEKEIGEIFYTGFSRGFEVSLDSQFNGYAPVKLAAHELKNREGNENKLFYRFNDIMEVLDSINNSSKIKEDIYGNTPKPTEEGFKIIDDCLGTLLSNIKHIKGDKEYNQALEVLKNKDYKITEISQEKIHLDSLV